MEADKELISVVIPTYNRAGTIMTSLGSVLAQTWPRIEVIVADDGSADGTEKLFEGVSDPRVRYFRYEPNRGACYARNRGAEIAVGSFIAFQDSDDTWRADKLEKQMAHMRASGADFTFCAMQRFTPAGKAYRFPVSGFDSGGNALRQLLLENRAGTQTMLMRREVWEAVRFDESFRRYQDWDFVLRVAAAGYRLAYLDEVLADSAVGSDSISAAVNSAPALEHLFNAHRAEFEAFPECLARYDRRMGNRLAETDPARAATYYKASFRIEGRLRDRAAEAKCALRAKREKT